MYKFLLIFLISFASAQRTCKLSFSNNSLSREGKVVFTIENLTGKRVKVPKQYPEIWAKPIDMQVYDEDKQDYVADDIDCFEKKGCFGRMIDLKKGESKEYELKIIPGRISRAFKEKKKYRFKLAFDTYLFSGCEDYRTDWLYYQN